MSDDLTDYRTVLDQRGIRDARIRFLTTSKKGSGPSYARNTALDAARGDFIAALDADDAYCPDRLEKLVGLAKIFGAAHSNVLVRAANGNDLGYLVHNQKNVFSLSLEALVHMSIASHPVFKKGLGEWDNNLCYGEIAKLNFRLHDCLGELPIDSSASYVYFHTQGSLINRPVSVSCVQSHRERELTKSIVAPEDFLNPDVHAGYIRSIRHKISIREAAEEACKNGQTRCFKDYLASKELLDITAYLKPLRAHLALKPAKRMPALSNASLIGVAL